MSNVKATLATVLALLSIGLTTFISQECQIQENSITCKCVGNTEFYLPDDYGYKNTTSLRISSCPSVNLLYPHLFDATHMVELVIENIGKRLILELILSTVSLSRFELSNVKRIPVIKHDIFISSQEIKHFTLRNVFIDSFVEHFTETRVINLTMVNVTINHVEGFNFKEKGEYLRIINCEFRNITKSLNFYFTNVIIMDSRFEMQKQEYFHVNSDYALVQNNVFFNVAMELVGNEKITINNTCADGNSNLRLFSFDVNSFNNKWPTAIIHSSNKQNDSKVPLEGNNVICIAGNCKCPKRNGQNGNQAVASTFLLEIFLIWLTYVMCND